MTETISTEYSPRERRRLTAARFDLSAFLRFCTTTLLLAALSVAVVSVSPEKERPIVSPAVVLLSIAILFATMLYRRRAALPLFELGGFYAAVVTVYGAYPLVQALVLHGNYTSRNDGRLITGQPTPAEIGSLGWLYVLYLGAFSAGYLLVRRRQAGRLVVQAPRQRVLFAIVALWIPAQLLLIVLQLYLAPRAGSYLDQYLVIQNLPMVTRQIVAHSQSIVPTLTIFLLAALFLRYGRNRNRFWIALILGRVIFISLRHGGDRTELFITLFAAALLYNQLIRRWTLPIVLAGGMAGLIAFTFLGYVRTPMPGDAAFSLQSSFQTASEFEAIFGNAYDLRYLRQAEGAFLNDPHLYWADLALLPQQLLPFPKTTAALWYLDTYYPFLRDLGGGMAFGAIPEALVGYGAVELAVRGLLLGLVFGAIHRVLSRRPSFWGLCFYVWLTVWSYQCFRNSMLSLLQPAVYHFIVPSILVMLVAYLTATTRHVGSRLRAFAAG